MSFPKGICGCSCCCLFFTPSANPLYRRPTHLRDILGSIDHINEFLRDLDYAAYQQDRTTRSAVEREMQIITEAAIRLGPDAESLCPGPDWKGFRGMGNLLRHAYHRVDPRLVWDTVLHELPPMRLAILRTLTALDPPPPTSS